MNTSKRLKRMEQSIIFTFGVFKRATVLGDLETLRTHERRMIRIDLGADVGRGLAALTRALEIALLNRLSVK